MTIEIDKSPPSDSSPSCCGGKSVADQQTTPSAIKAEEVKAKPKSAMASCCGGATTDGAGREHEKHD